MSAHRVRQALYGEAEALGYGADNAWLSAKGDPVPSPHPEHTEATIAPRYIAHWATLRCRISKYFRGGTRA